MLVRSRQAAIGTVQDARHALAQMLAANHCRQTITSFPKRPPSQRHLPITFSACRRSSDSHAVVGLGEQPRNRKKHAESCLLSALQHRSLPSESFETVASTAMFPISHSPFFHLPISHTPFPHFPFPIFPVPFFPYPIFHFPISHC